jgi:ABC-2 type transport system ATP-binding protein
MPHVELHNVGIDFPVYDATTRSLKNRLIGQMKLGGRIGEDAERRIHVTALDGISFILEHGDRVAILGANGAGKSTLLRVIAGIYEPMRGRICTEGRIAPLFDIALGLDLESTGYENITLRGLYLGMSRAEIRARKEEIAHFTELGDYLEMPLRTYSTGMILRLGFAVSTHVDADILLMDEWIGAGDSAFTAKAQRRLLDLVDEAAILVLASHSEDIIRHVCNKAILLKQGSIAHAGSVDDALQVYKAIN